MRRRLAALLIGASCALPAAVSADSFDPVSFGVQASSLGYGIVLERPLLFNLSARVSTGWQTTPGQQTYDNNVWGTSFKQRNVLVALDWRPYAGRWRLSGGLVFANDELDLTAQSVGGTYRLNGNRYSVAQAGQITGRVSYSAPAPYIGVGAGTGIARGLVLAFDAGVVLRNGSTTLSATGLQNDPQFQSDLGAVGGQFRTRFLQPVISIGAVYRP